MKKHLIDLGQQLRVECPENDCVIYLNIYNMWVGIEQDLRGCALSSHGKRILESEKKMLQLEMEKMYYTNFAVRKYRTKSLVRD